MKTLSFCFSVVALMLSFSSSHPIIPVPFCSTISLYFYFSHPFPSPLPPLPALFTVSLRLFNLQVALCSTVELSLPQLDICIPCPPPHPSPSSCSSAQFFVSFDCLLPHPSCLRILNRPCTSYSSCQLFLFLSEILPSHSTSKRKENPSNYSPPTPTPAPPSSLFRPFQSPLVGHRHLT